MKLLLTTRMGDPYFGMLDDVQDVQKVWADSPDDIAATQVRQRASLETLRALLGHTTLAATLQHVILGGGTIGQRRTHA